jgi:hypothetical protein
LIIISQRILSLNSKHSIKRKYFGKEE